MAGICARLLDVSPQEFVIMHQSYINEQLEIDALRFLRTDDEHIHYPIRRIRQAMVAGGRTRVDEPLPIPDKVNVESIRGAMECYWKSIDLLDQAKRQLWEIVDALDPESPCDDDALLDEFVGRTQGDIARLELLAIARRFPNATGEDIELFEFAIKSIGGRVARYIASREQPASGGGVDEAVERILSGQSEQSDELEASATFRAIILEKSLSQGISEEDALAQEQRRWA